MEHVFMQDRLLLLLGDFGGAVDARIAARVGGVEAVFEARFQKAMADGLLLLDCGARALARFYGAVLLSLEVMHKALGETAALDDIITVALNAWPEGPPESRPDAAML